MQAQMWASGPAFYYLIVIIIGLFGNEFWGFWGIAFMRHIVYTEKEVYDL